MGGFSIWHWVVVLVFFAGIGCAIYFGTKKARNTELAPEQLSGFGGWLLILAIGQCVAPLRVFVDLSGEISGYSRLATLPNGEIAAIGELFLNAVYLAFLIYVTMMMLKRKRSFPRLIRYEWFAVIVVPIIDHLWTAATLGMPLNELVEAGEVGRVIGSAIVMGAWVWYTSVSVRVKNTFTA
jgi:hypothetical protein